MAQEDEEYYTVQLSDDFYRDSFNRFVVVVLGGITACALLIILSLYLFLSKPKPVLFPVSADWRVQELVPLEKPYRQAPDLLQWVSDVLQKSFVYDFVHYKQQQNEARHYFTTDGWNSYLNQLNNYANYNNVQRDKLFINATAKGAPFILQQGVLSGRYAWWVQMPIFLSYVGAQPLPPGVNKNLILKVLVVRVPIQTNLTGIAIDNVIIETVKSNPFLGNG